MAHAQRGSIFLDQKLLSLLLEGSEHVTGVADSFQHGGKPKQSMSQTRGSYMTGQGQDERGIFDFGLKDLETSRSLVKNAVQNAVENHLRQFLLNDVDWKVNLLCHMLNLNARERLDDALQVLCKKRVVEKRYMSLDNDVTIKLLSRTSEVEQETRIQHK